MQILEHLLRYPLKHRATDLTAVMPTYRRVQNYGDRDCRVVDRSESRERRDVLSPRISSGSRINFLRRACLTGRAVALENGFFAGSVQDNTLHHLLHLRSGQRREHATLLGGMKGNHSRRSLWLDCGRKDSRSDQNTVIRDT